MESHLGLILEKSWYFEMDPLVVLMMASLSAYLLETHCNLLIVKCLTLIKSPNVGTWSGLHVVVVG